jgi:hypothetical protein
MSLVTLHNPREDDLVSCSLLMSCSEEYIPIRLSDSSDVITEYEVRIATTSRRGDVRRVDSIHRGK